MLSLSLSSADSFTHIRKRSLQNNFQKKRYLWNFSASPLQQHLKLPANVKQFHPCNTEAVAGDKKRETPRSFCGSTLALEVWDWHLYCWVSAGPELCGTWGSSDCSIIGDLERGYKLESAEDARTQRPGCISHAYGTALSLQICSLFSVNKWYLYNTILYEKYNEM